MGAGEESRGRFFLAGSPVVRPRANAQEVFGYKQLGDASERGSLRADRGKVRYFYFITWPG